MNMKSYDSILNDGTITDSVIKEVTSKDIPITIKIILKISVSQQLMDKGIKWTN